MYKPDIGTVISLDTGAVITGATVTIEVKKPSGATASWPGTVSGIQLVQHTIAIGDFTESGEYLLQAKVVVGSSKWYGKTTKILVKEVFQ